MSYVSRFKVGDQVRCVVRRPGLTFGKVYTVLGIHQDCLRIEGDFGREGSYFDSRFEFNTVTEAEILDEYCVD